MGGGAGVGSWDMGRTLATTLSFAGMICVAISSAAELYAWLKLDSAATAPPCCWATGASCFERLLVRAYPGATAFRMMPPRLVGALNRPCRSNRLGGGGAGGGGIVTGWGR